MGVLKMSGISRLSPPAAFIHLDVSRSAAGQRPRPRPRALVCTRERTKQRKKKRREHLSNTWRKAAVPSQCECSFIKSGLYIFPERIGRRFFIEDLFFFHAVLSLSPSLLKIQKQILINVISHKVAGWKSSFSGQLNVLHIFL